jgi:hypothetical protein
LPKRSDELATWNYTGPGSGQSHQIAGTSRRLGKAGIEGTVEQPAIAAPKDVFIGEDHPMVVIDAANGPVYLDEEVEVHPFTASKGRVLLSAELAVGDQVPRG